MIESARAKLRRFNSDDYENLRMLDCEEDIMKFTPAKTIQTPEQTRERLVRYSNNPGVWAAVDKSTNDFIGWFMLITTDLPYSEIGFMLVKKYWNKGLATEISRAMIEHAFTHGGHGGISARTTTDNFPSMQVLRKLGFTQTQKDEMMIFTLKA
jgi:RimJ/RimL family protein N-acetyltransferase